MPALGDRILQFKFNRLANTVISDQFPGAGRDQDLTCLCQVIGDTQFHKRVARQQKFPATENTTYMAAVMICPMLTASLR